MTSPRPRRHPRATSEVLRAKGSAAHFALRTSHLALLLLLAGCIDFVDPVGLGLARRTRLELVMELYGDAATAPCETAPGTVPASAALCVRGFLYPGLDRFGALLPVPDDTLWVLGTPVAPTLGADSVLRYQRRIPLDRARLGEMAVEVTLPAVEGVDVAPRSLRWPLVGPAGPDSVVRAPGEALRLGVAVSRAAPAPRPRSQFWAVDVGGSAATASLRGATTPPATFTFPADILAGLGGERFTVGMRWQQTYDPPVTSELQLYVYLVQYLGWRVVPR